MFEVERLDAPRVRTKLHALESICVSRWRVPDRGRAIERRGGGEIREQLTPVECIPNRTGGRDPDIPTHAPQRDLVVGLVDMETRRCMAARKEAIPRQHIDE